VVSEYGDIVFGFQSDKQKYPSFGLTHNWVKRSILWELFYWKTNLLHHNLDIIHIEKKKRVREHFQHGHGREGEDKEQHQGKNGYSVVLSP